MENRFIKAVEEFRHSTYFDAAVVFAIVFVVTLVFIA
jgi:hypothetical protein